eukprot:TRINITY_DN25035_c0_g2_i2.p1 TRINITY_DN25035_c0_g2~~TRINITY_DN25035_c0_g2_i2.p1  ORF type:complete len:512 (+),score=71.52 TRINITY_DN25035_c0_g2_i2:83-1618(+)
MAGDDTVTPWIVMIVAMLAGMLKLNVLFSKPSVGTEVALIREHMASIATRDGQMDGLARIVQLAQTNVDNIAAMRSLGVLEIVHEAMKQFPEEHTIHSQAFGILWIFAISDVTLQNQMVSEGVANTTLEIMSQHLQVEETQVRGLAALWAFVYQNAKTQESLCSLDYTSFVFDIMQANRHSEVVQIHALWFLRFCEHDTAAHAAMASQLNLSHVLIALRPRRHDPEEQFAASSFDGLVPAGVRSYKLAVCEFWKSAKGGYTCGLHDWYWDLKSEPLWHDALSRSDARWHDILPSQLTLEKAALFSDIQVVVVSMGSYTSVEHIQILGLEILRSIWYTTEWTSIFANSTSWRAAFVHADKLLTSFGVLQVLSTAMQVHLSSKAVQLVALDTLMSFSQNNSRRQTDILAGMGKLLLASTRAHLSVAGIQQLAIQGLRLLASEFKDRATDYVDAVLRALHAHSNSTAVRNSCLRALDTWKVVIRLGGASSVRAAAHRYLEDPPIPSVEALVSDI